MISHIFGKIIYKDDKKIIIDKNGIGFEVFIAPSDIKELLVGEEKDIYTFLFVGEKVLELYGFLTPQRLELFKTLKNVSGVGPKTAMNLAVLGSLEKLKEALEKGEMPSEIKGVGTKKLQKILLEITGRIEEIKKSSSSKKIIKKDEVLDALISLGFTKQEASEAVSQVENIEDSKERLKEALKYLGK